jgi:alkyldihydroxyacetonephosphate synthase
MRRWNGWGDDSVEYALPAAAESFLKALVGDGTPPQDVAMQQVLQCMPASRLPENPLVTADPQQRLLHTCGQSLPDWVALRSGQINAYPDGVAYPTDETEIRQLLQFAQKHDLVIIPYGGGTSVVGHISPLPGSRPVLTVDMSRMNRLSSFDPQSRLASFGAGVTGPDLEAQLRSRGCTLGHFPQSFEYSTLGGWVATRSSGQQSLRYGRIEKLFAGGRLISPSGSLDLPAFPASAAGPDLRELILGSEGRLGILSEVSVRASALPEKEEFHAVFFPDFEHGCEAVRQMLACGLPLAMLRLSTAVETVTSLALAGHEVLIGALEKLLALRGLGEAKCMLLVGFSGPNALVRAARGEALRLAGKQGGVAVVKTFAEQWIKNRFRTPYLRNTLWERGYAIDTLETATSWSNVPAMITGIEKALRAALSDSGERVHIFTHLSHLYPYGSSIYTTCLFRLAGDPQETLRRWKLLKAAASQFIVRQGGTISHQHGVGIDHLPYLPAEKGELGMQALKNAILLFDPNEMMNPGKLIA